MGKKSRDKGAEQWKPVDGFHGLYEVSDQGRVRSTELSLKGSSLLTTRVRKHGYVEVHLFDRNARKYRDKLVHRLVAAAFIGPQPDDPLSVVCHWDGDRLNNRASNLRWGTRKENEADKLRHGTKLLGEGANAAVLTEQAVREIRAIYDSRSSVHWGAAQLMRRYGVSRSTLARVATREYWSHVR